MRCSAWLLIVWSCASATAAAEIRVAPPASDARPQSSIQQAIDAAAPGDTLIIGPGTYREILRVKKPLTLRGESGAVIDGSTPLVAEWSPVADLPGVWTAPVRSRPHGLLVDGRFVAEIRFDRAQKDGDWHWRQLLRAGAPLSGFDEIRALWMYNPDEQLIYARFENRAAPANLSLSIIESDEPLLRIYQTRDVTVEGLTFAAGVEGIVLSDGAENCVVRNCRVTSFENCGILFASGAARCTVEDCDITRGSLEEWMPSLEHNRANYEIWRIHKEVGRYDRNAINLIRAGAANRILRNRLHRVFDGIALGDYKAESLDVPLPDAEHGRGTEIAGNVIEHTRDSGIELGVGSVDVSVHHNTLTRTHGGLRFKLPRLGPLFIHHNRFIDGAPFAIWFSMDASPAEAYVYHNTILRGGDEALVVSRDSMRRDFIAPRWHFLNNLTLNSRGFCHRSEGQPLDFTAAHNVSTGKIRPWPDDPARDIGSVYGATIDHDAAGRPVPGSAAQDAGLDLSTYREGKPLPGCEPGYFRGRAPDVGADEVDSP